MQKKNHNNNNNNKLTDKEREARESQRIDAAIEKTQLRMVMQQRRLKAARLEMINCLRLSLSLSLSVLVSVKTLLLLLSLSLSLPPLSL
jgi:hypothetical protein